MACSDYSKLRDFWANGQFWDGGYCYYANQIGGDFTQLMIFATLIAGFYAYSREPPVVLVLAIILGSVWVAPLPGAIATGFTALATLALAGVLYLLVMRLKARGGL